MNWPRHHTIDNTEATAAALIQAIDTITDLTGLPAGQVQGRILAAVAARRPELIREWSALHEAVNDGS